MESTVTNSQAPRLSWSMDAIGGRTAKAAGMLLLTAPTGRSAPWLAVVILMRPQHRPEILMRDEVANHGAMRWAERAAADLDYARRTCSERKLLAENTRVAL